MMRDNLVNIRELNLFRCGDNDFRGDDIWEMKSLEVLILRECLRIDVPTAEVQIRNLVHLKHINLMGCIWLTD